MDLCNPSVIKQLMAKAGTLPQKKFGQNFLINRAIPARIADECADSSDRLILEIGPGIGCLTKELAERYDSISAVEIDTSLIPILSETVGGYDNVEVVNADIMSIDLADFISSRACGREVSVAANLPYYITTPILMKLLESGVRFSSVTVMVQSEVADRLVAKAGSPDYGAISVAIAYYGEAKKLFDVPAGNFLPAPKVDSAVVRIDISDKPRVRPIDEKLFFDTVRSAFGQRRKTLTNALKACFGDRIGKDALTSAVIACTGRGDIRGERLTVEDFVRLSDTLHDLLKE